MLDAVGSLRNLLINAVTFPCCVFGSAAKDVKKSVDIANNGL
jgi:hypothetical protein